MNRSTVNLVLALTMGLAGCASDLEESIDRDTPETKMLLAAPCKTNSVNSLVGCTSPLPAPIFNILHSSTVLPGFLYQQASDNSGNSFVTGFTLALDPGSSNLLPRAVLAKFDSALNLQQTYETGSPQDGALEYGTAVATAGSQAVFVGATTSNLPGFQNHGFMDGFLIKVDTSGQVVIRRQFGGATNEFPMSVVMDQRGWTYVASLVFVANEENSPYRIVLSAFDYSLIPMWSSDLAPTGGPGSFINFASFPVLGLDKNGNIVIAYMKDDYSAMTILKYYNAGHRIAEATLGTAQDVPTSIVTDFAGNTFVGGRQGGMGPVGGLPSDTPSSSFVIKADYYGQAIWAWRPPTSTAPNFRQTGSAFVALNSSGDIYVAGDIYGGQDGYADTFLAKLSATGALQWQHLTSAPESDRPMGIRIATEGVRIVGAASVTMPENSPLGYGTRVFSATHQF